MKGCAVIDAGIAQKSEEMRVADFRPQPLHRVDHIIQLAYRIVAREPGQPQPDRLQSAGGRLDDVAVGGAGDDLVEKTAGDLARRQIEQKQRSGVIGKIGGERQAAPIGPRIDGFQRLQRQDPQHFLPPAPHEPAGDGGNREFTDIEGRHTHPFRFDARDPGQQAAVGDPVAARQQQQESLPLVEQPPGQDIEQREGRPVGQDERRVSALLLRHPAGQLGRGHGQQRIADHQALGRRAGLQQPPPDFDQIARGRTIGRIEDLARAEGPGVEAEGQRMLPSGRIDGDTRQHLSPGPTRRRGSCRGRMKPRPCRLPRSRH